MSGNKIDVNDAVITMLGSIGTMFLIALFVTEPIAQNPMLGILGILLLIVSYALALYFVKRAKSDGVFLSFSMRLALSGILVAGLASQISASAFYQPETEDDLESYDNEVDHIKVKNQALVDFKKELESCAKANALLLQHAKIKQAITDAAIEKQQTNDANYKDALDSLTEQLKTKEKELMDKRSSLEIANIDDPTDPEESKENEETTEEDFLGIDVEELDIPERHKETLRNHSARSSNLLEDVATFLTLPGRALGSLLGMGGSTKRSVKNVAGSIAAEKIPNQADLYHLFSATDSPLTLKIELLALADRAIAQGNVGSTFKNDLERAIDRAIDNSGKRPSPDVRRAIERYQQIGYCDTNQILRVMPGFSSELSKAKQLARVKEIDIRNCLAKIPVK
ncbi:MAG: hypothetical protein CML60_10680 [Rhodobacteraceae bacterium]|nr:hypothetical protein [Paracoccaceae bacterium]